jgi:hypothetical protein
MRPRWRYSCFRKVFRNVNVRAGDVSSWWFRHSRTACEIIVTIQLFSEMGMRWQYRKMLYRCTSALFWHDYVASIYHSGNGEVCRLLVTYTLSGRISVVFLWAHSIKKNPGNTTARYLECRSTGNMEHLNTYSPPADYVMRSADNLQVANISAL